MQRTIAIFYTMSLLLILASCTKQGPQGVPGPAGDTGATGATGPAGASGVPGSQIYSGTTTPATTVGNVGDYYLDKTSGALYGPKTANGWGPPIPLSSSGTQGPAGPAGPAGPTGATGTAGAPGPRGATGAAGATGATGAAGAKGATGAAGSQIYSGQGAPPSGTGVTGDYYIDDLHAVIYGPKTAGGWPAKGLSLQVNNTITYDFVDKVAQNLPYNWVQVFPTSGPQYTWIYLPYNNAAAQTAGFTIPQSIADNGTILCYIRYFGAGGPNDTATDAGLSQWFELPYAPTYYINGITQQYSITSRFNGSAFTIYLNGLSPNDGQGESAPTSLFADNEIVATLRIVLIPPGTTNTITREAPRTYTIQPRP